VLTERECIDLIRQYTRDQDEEYLVKGIGDDCAVLNKNDEKCLLLTTDTLVEGVHFDLSWHDPYLLGRKSASVNLSDIAAMGGQPQTCLLNVSFPAGVPPWFNDFMAGFAAVLSEHDTLLVGGDTVKGKNDIVVTVTVVGEADKKNICYRSGAQPGDIIWVSGPLGYAAAGLELCRKGCLKDDEMSGKYQKLMNAHLDPQALIGLGGVLASSGFVHAMMDISDGLATDLAHLCKESGVMAEIEENFLPVSELLKNAAAEIDADVLDWVLRGGEDYQLLFITRASDEQKILRIVAGHAGEDIFSIGQIREGQGVYLCNAGGRREISYQGYDHFLP